MSIICSLYIYNNVSSTVVLHDMEKLGDSCDKCCTLVIILPTFTILDHKNRQPKDITSSETFWNTDTLSSSLNKIVENDISGVIILCGFK